MRIFEKLKKVILFALVSINTFSFVISSVDFDEKLSKNSVVEKKYSITNTKDYSLKYRFSVDDKDVSIEPQSFILLAGQTKEFKIKAKGNKDYGVHKYIFRIEEEVVNKDRKNALALNYNYNISQKYEIVK